RDRRADAPAQLAVRTADAELGLKRRCALHRGLDRALQMLPVLGMDQRLDVVDGEIEAVGVHAEYAVLAVVPDEMAIDRIPFPGAHLAGGERQAAALLALHEPRTRRLELGRALGDAALELAVELLELAGLAIELGEYPHLGAQHLRDHRHRNV